MHGEPATGVDHGVPHPQAALLGLTEVVRVHEAGDPGVKVHGDEAVLRIAGHRQVGGVDHHQLGVPVVCRSIGREVELLLHARDIRVGLLDVEAYAGPLVGFVADVPVDHEHVAASDVVGLDLGDATAFLG